MARVKPVDWAPEAKIVVVFLFAVFPILINAFQGVRKCDKNILEVTRSFRSPEWKMWEECCCPLRRPYIAAGIRLAIGRGLVGMVIAEFYTTISGWLHELAATPTCSPCAGDPADVPRHRAHDISRPINHRTGTTKSEIPRGIASRTTKPLLFNHTARWVFSCAVVQQRRRHVNCRADIDRCRIWM